MNKTIKPGMRFGAMNPPASKSISHRMLIAAALSSHNCEIECHGLSNDITATIDCLKALGSEITIDGDIIKTTPCKRFVEDIAFLPCRESGSTLRFLIPVVGALHREAVFQMEGRLSERPLDELLKVCREHGMKFMKDGNSLYVSGHLHSGEYEIPGNISSQYITGLLFALPLVYGSGTLKVTGNIESAGYIQMTEDVLNTAKINFHKEGNIYHIDAENGFDMPENAAVEKDWSGAAFPLCMGALSEEGIEVDGLLLSSSQGDKQILDVLKKFGAIINISDTKIVVKKGKLTGIELDAHDIPDLVPVISTVAAFADGKTVIYGAERLKLKESDRIESTANMLKSLGADVIATDDGLIINGKQKLSGGFVDSYSDHRIAMSACVASLGCENEVIVSNAECTDKSYPDFWEDFEALKMI